MYRYLTKISKSNALYKLSILSLAFVFAEPYDYGTSFLTYLFVLKSRQFLRLLIIYIYIYIEIYI